jgi:hypothetical protein
MRYLILIFVVTASLLSGLASAAQTELMCEYGLRMSIAGDHHKDSVIEMIWKGYVYRMQRVSTSTGVNRFEHPQSGLIWISIPSKVMLLDGQQRTPIVSECRTQARAKQ